MRAINLNIS